jgi:hypothetical protein
LLASAAPSPETAPIPLEWTIAKTAPANRETVRFAVTYRSPGEGESHDASFVALPVLEGLSAANLEATSPVRVRFRLVREAGRFECTGVVHRSEGTGTCDFIADPAYANGLARHRISRPGARGQLQLALRDVRLDLVSELERQGYRTPDVADLIRAGIFRVDAPFLRALGSLHFRAGTVDMLIQLRIHQVTPDFVRTAIATGYRDLTPDQAVNMRVHGITAATLREYAALGYAPVAYDALIAMAVHRVSPDFVRERRAAGCRDLSPDRLVSMRIHPALAQCRGDQ